MAAETGRSTDEEGGRIDQGRAANTQAGDGTETESATSGGNGRARRVKGPAAEKRHECEAELRPGRTSLGDRRPNEWMEGTNAKRSAGSEERAPTEP